MTLYKNTKVKVHSPNGDTDFFDIVAGVPQEDTLLRMKENGFRLKKGKKQTIPNRNYYGHRLHKCPSASCKYTYPSWIPAA